MNLILIYLENCKNRSLIDGKVYDDLKSILSMRNSTGISHPNDHTVRADELGVWLRYCVEFINKKSAAAVSEVENFLEAKSPSGQDLATIKKRIAILSEVDCQKILTNFILDKLASGWSDLYKDIHEDKKTILSSLWYKSSESALKDKIIQSLESFCEEALPDDKKRDKKEEYKKFLEIIQICGEKAQKQFYSLFREWVNDLANTHRGPDNYVNETPLAESLYLWFSDSLNLTKEDADFLFSIILTCRVGKEVRPGKGKGFSWGALGYYDGIIYLASKKYAQNILDSLEKLKLMENPKNINCLQNAVELLSSLKSNLENKELTKKAGIMVASYEEKIQEILQNAKPQA